MKTGIKDGRSFQRAFWCCILFLLFAGLPFWLHAGEVTGFWPGNPRTAKWNNATPTAIRDAANQGDSSAQLALARLCLDGSQFAPDPVEAFGWYEKAAEQGEPESQFMIGVQSELGLFAPRDYKRALLWFQMAADQGFTAAQLKMGLLSITRYPYIAQTVGKVNYVQRGLVEGSYESTVKWLEKAAGAGNPTAQAQLARIYRRLNSNVELPSKMSSEEVRRLRLKGLTWLYLASARGEPDTQFVKMFYSGADFSPMTNEARLLASEYMKTIGSKEFRHEYDSLLFLKPIPAAIDQGRSKARFDALVRLAEGGDLRSQYLLGLCSQFGDYPGTKMINQFEGREAAEWYTKAAERGYIPAQLAIGFLYRNLHFRDSTNLTRAAHWFQKASESGSPAALFQLGQMYDAGEGVARDYTRAVKLYQSAASLKYPPAMKELNLLATGNEKGSSLARNGLIATHDATFGIVKPLRLAVISASSIVQGPADVLMARMSKTPGFALVERDQISRILEEQARTLASGSPRDYLKLEQMLGADCVLLVEQFQRGSNSRLSLRLVAVNAGAVIDWVDYPLPVPDMDGWSGLVANRLSVRMARLGERPGKIVPLSILNLRSPIVSPEAQALDRELTLLLSHRLSSEKALVVLERREMKALEREKSLASVEDSRFWGGGYLLEGTLNKDGTKGSAVTVSAKLTPPDGGQPIFVEVAGERHQPVGVINELSAKIVEELRIDSGAAVWNPIEEAARYFEEAQWALNWKQFPEAQSAADAAWALGLRTRTMAELRVKCFGYEPQHSARITDKEGNSVNWLRSAKSFDGLSVEQSSHALELFNEFTTDLLNKGRLSNSWYELGREMLLRASVILQVFAREPEKADSISERLVELRGRCRQTLSLLDTFPPLRRESLRIRLDNSAVFYDRPEDYVKMLLGVAESDYCNELRQSELAWKWQPGIPVGWDLEGRQRAAQLISRLLAGMDASTNVMVRLDGAAWGVGLAVNGNALDGGSDYEVEYRCGLLMRIIMEAGDVLFRITDNGAYSFERLLLPLAGATSGKQSEIKTRLKEAIIPEFERKVKIAKEEWIEQQRLMRVKLLAAELAKRPHIGLAEIMRNFGGLAVTGADSELLLKNVTAYRQTWKGSQSGSNWLAGIQAKLSVTVQATNASIGMKVSQFPKVESSLPADGSTVRVPMSSAANARVPSGPIPSTFAGHAPADQGAQKISSSLPFLDVKRVWNVDALQGLGGKRFHECNLFPLGYRNGKMWFRVDCRSFNDLGNETYRRLFCGVSPETLEAQVEEAEVKGSVDYFASNVEFEVLDNRIMYSANGALKELNLKSHSWREVQMTLPRDRFFYTFYDRIFCTSADSILEANTDEGTVKLLASCRRRPGLTALDQMDSLNFPPLWMDKRMQPVSLVAGRVWHFQGQKGDWIADDVLPSMSNWVIKDASIHGIAMMQRLVGGTSLRVLSEHETNATTLFLEFDLQRDINEIVGGVESSKLGRRSAVELNLMDAAIDGGDVWVCSVASRWLDRNSKPISAPEYSLALVCYRENISRPGIVLLPVPGFKEGSESAGAEMLTKMMAGRISCHPYPGGIAIFDTGFQGFWMINKEDIQRTWEKQDKKLPEGEILVKRQELENIRKRYALLMSREKQWLQMFDSNRNGRLDDDEIQKAMNHPIYNRDRKELNELVRAIGESEKTKSK